jgi:hypothetical protein
MQRLLWRFICFCHHSLTTIYHFLPEFLPHRISFIFWRTLFYLKLTFLSGVLRRSYNLWHLEIKYFSAINKTHKQRDQSDAGRIRYFAFFKTFWREGLTTADSLDGFGPFWSHSNHRSKLSQKICKYFKIRRGTGEKTGITWKNQQIVFVFCDLIGHFSVHRSFLCSVDSDWQLRRSLKNLSQSNVGISRKAKMSEISSADDFSGNLLGLALQWTDCQAFDSFRRRKIVPTTG